MLLSKKHFESWKDIQDIHEDYMASLSFETIEEVNEFLSFEYKIETENAKRLTGNINTQEDDIQLIF